MTTITTDAPTITLPITVSPIPAPPPPEPPFQKLADAILRGAALAPQGFDFLIDGETGATCALGAAAMASGIDLSIGASYCGIVQACHVDPLTVVVHPVMGSEEQLVGTILNLNDTHRWSRERIAGWLMMARPIEEEDR